MKKVIGHLRKVNYAHNHLKENGGKIVSISGGHFSFAFFPDTAFFPLMALVDFDGIIIESTDPHYTYLQIKRIRSFFEFQLFLKPTFLLKTAPSFQVILEQSIDGEIVDLQDLSFAIQTTSGILKRIDRISQQLGDLPYERKMLHYTLGYLNSRQNKDIIPCVDRMSNLGYNYPVLHLYLQDNPSMLLNILQEGEKHGLLDGRFVDSIHVCNKCYNGFLMYREVCPSCYSAEVEEEELIHHFRCANIGPKSDYLRKSGEELICPKCDHQLSHIGVDYDKPSVLYSCKKCDESFQQYQVKAKCTSCHQDTDIGNLLKKNIKSYHLTTKGEEWVMNPSIWTEASDREIQIKGTVTKEVFMVMLKYEMSKRTARRNCVTTIHWGNFYNTIRNLGDERYTSIMVEIINIVKASIHSFDLLCIEGPILYFTQLGARPSRATEIAERTLYLIQHLIHDNLNINPEDLKFEVAQMNRFESPEELIKALIN